MQRTRRDLLAGVGVAAGSAGCLGVDGVTYPDEPDSGDGDADGGGEPDGSDGDGSDSDSDGGDPGPNPALAAATRGVVGDALWFATSYEAAVRVYREAAADVLTEVDAVRESVREATDPTAAMAERLDAAGDDAAERAAAALEPYFSPAGLLRSRTDRHVPVLDRFARRNDADRFVEELERMRLSFFQIRTPIYVGRRFSRDPIHNRLLDRLAPGDPGGVVVELAVPERRRFATLAHRPYPDGDDNDDGETYPPTFTDDALPAARRESLRGRLGPVARPDGRTAELFFTFADRPEPADDESEAFRGPPSELGGAPLHVQRYADAETASDRLDAALSGGGSRSRRRRRRPPTRSSGTATTTGRQGATGRTSTSSPACSTDTCCRPASSSSRPASPATRGKSAPAGRAGSPTLGWRRDSTALAAAGPRGRRPRRARGVSRRRRVERGRPDRR